MPAVRQSQSILVEITNPSPANLTLLLEKSVPANLLLRFQRLWPVNLIEIDTVGAQSQQGPFHLVKIVLREMKRGSAVIR